MAWITEDPVRSAIAFILFGIILLYIWGFCKRLIVGEVIKISKQRFLHLEAIEARFLNGECSGAAPAAAAAATQTVVKKVVMKPKGH